MGRQDRKRASRSHEGARHSPLGNFRETNNNDTMTGQPTAPEPNPTAAIDAEIIADKAIRRSIDAEIQAVKALPPSRERSLAVTKLQEAVMWLGMDLKRIHETTGAGSNPYPNSKDPSNTTIEPTADGLKL